MHFIWIFLSVNVIVQKYRLRTLFLRLILEPGPPFYVVNPATRRSGSLQGKGSIYKTCTPFPFCHHKKCTPPPLLFHFTLLLKISLLQKSVIHVLSNSEYGSYTASLFAKLKI